MRLIDADALWMVTEGYHQYYEKFEIENAPTVEPKHGRWIRNDNGTYSCSECKSWIPNEQYYYARYCLFCGAKMDEVKENG